MPAPNECADISCIMVRAGDRVKVTHAKQEERALRIADRKFLFSFDFFDKRTAISWLVFPDFSPQNARNKRNIILPAAPPP